MDARVDPALDPAVDRALAAAGFRAAARDVHGSWHAVALDGSDRAVEMHVLPRDATTTARAHALQSARHEHLARVLEVVVLDEARLGVFADHVEGLPLDRLCAAREPLEPGEAATVAIPVAQALEALHAAGVQHGAVTAGAVVVGHDGRPVLAGLGAALRHVPRAHDESAEDVRALLAAVLSYLAVAREPTVPGDGLRAALEDLWHETAPAAGRVVDRCFRAAVPCALRLPAAPDLTAPRRTAPGADEAGAPTRSIAALRDGGRGGAGAHRVPRGARESRTRARVVRPVLIGALALGLAAAGTAVVLVAPWRGTTDGGPAAASVPSTPALAGTVPGAGSGHGSRRLAPDDAAVALTQRRAALLEAGERAALEQVEVEGSPAHEADERMLASLGDDRVAGLEVTVTRVEALDDGTGDEARVRLTSTTSAYERVAPDGTRRAGGPAATSTVVLVLRWTEHGWRVWDVAAGA
ncbi:protein kinase family protein [Cellulomonas palmilytica]|uniref:hypothetical protein n=1 Tax=Cellulomonas palmilytica TaxID=2608402 RepID=UPI001F1922D2|nr:hypothetical protein [Cellulomonas palmilytica]UJP39244.1 hypothetical protein F1D97_12965 [Cellulomonas palmilytica]